MRIAQVILSRRMGGAERHTIDLINHLAGSHEVHAILRREQRRDRAETHMGSIRHALDPAVTVWTVGRIFPGWQLSRILGRIHPDITHCHLGRGAQLAARSPHTGIRVATLHGDYKDHCYRSCHGLICVSPAQETGISDDFGGVITPIPNWIPPRPIPAPDAAATRRRELGIPADSRVVGGIGRWQPEKGFDTLLQAFARANLVNTHLVLVGGGPENAALARQAKAMEAAGHPIHLCPWRADPWPDMQMFDLLVCPSRSESFGIVLLEAMALGTPVLSTRTTGPQSFLTENNAVQVDIDDVPAMATALTTLIEHPEHAQTLAAQARIDVQAYRADCVLPKIPAFYARLMGDTRNPA